MKSGLNADFESLSVKLKSQEAKLKDFCRQTGIPRQPSREQVFSIKTEKAIKHWGKSVSQKAVQANKTALTRKAKSDIINKIKACSIRCETIHLTPKPIDADSLIFDDVHINKKRKHNISRLQAVDFVKNAIFSATAWKGKREKYYGFEGVAYVDVEEGIIKTAFGKNEFDDTILKALEVYKSHGK